MTHKWVTGYKNVSVHTQKVTKRGSSDQHSAGTLNKF